MILFKEEMSVEHETSRAANGSIQIAPNNVLVWPFSLSNEIKICYIEKYDSNIRNYSSMYSPFSSTRHFRT